MRKLFVGIAICVLPLVSSGADSVWRFENVMIEEVTTFWQDGYYVVQVKLDDTSNPTATYSCAPTSQARVVSYWHSGHAPLVDNLQAAAIAAHAQGIPVDINTQQTNCSTAAGWPNGDGMPFGLGLRMMGIRHK